MSQIMSPEAHAFFAETMGAYRRTKVLLVGHRLGIFDLLETGERTAREVALELRTHPDATAVLLRGLGALSILEVRGGRFRNSELASRHLVSSAPGYVGNNLKFQDMLWESWSELERVVRTGRPRRSLPELLSRRDQSFTSEYIRAMDVYSRTAAREVAEILSTVPMASMIDVGGGAATYSLALVERNPTLSAVVLDLPATMRVTSEIVRDSPYRERLVLREGNYLSDGYGSEHDLVLMSHVTHDECESGVSRMVEAAFAALKPGGRVAIHDFVVDEDGTTPMHAAMFSVNVMVYTNGGRVYSRSEYRSLLERAGFAGFTTVMVLEGKIPSPTCLVIGEKP